MRGISLSYCSRILMAGEFPAPSEPAWAPRVDRWNQLDEAAFALIQAYWEWKDADAREDPAMILLASPGASNATDWAFARTGAISPARFAHTLPNTRGTALLQAMAWSGPLLCLQNGPRTLVSGLTEGAHATSNLKRPGIWVLGVSEARRALGFFLDASQSGRGELEMEVEVSAAAEETPTALPTDSDLLTWMESGTSPELSLGEGLRIKRRSAN